MKKLFYELMQVGMGQLDCLSRGPSPEEWHELYELAQREAVAGICYRGAVSLFEYGLRAPQDLIIDWMSESEEIREHNELTMTRLTELQRRVADGGTRTSVLSGDGLFSYYGDELFYLRESSAIDVYCKNVVSAASHRGGSDLDVNLMASVRVGHGIWKNRRMEKWVQQNSDMLFCRRDGLTIPAPTMHVVLYMAYLYNRLMGRNLCMRDLMDYYYILRAADGGYEPFYEQGQTVGDVLRMLRLSRFASGVMWLLQEVFGLERRCMPVEPVEQEGRFLVDDVLLDYRVLPHWSHLLAGYSWSDLLKS